MPTVATKPAGIPCVSCGTRTPHPLCPPCRKEFAARMARRHKLLQGAARVAVRGR